MASTRYCRGSEVAVRIRRVTQQFSALYFRWVANRQTRESVKLLSSGTVGSTPTPPTTGIGLKPCVVATPPITGKHAGRRLSDATKLSRVGRLGLERWSTTS